MVKNFFDMGYISRDIIKLYVYICVNGSKIALSNVPNLQTNCRFKLSFQNVDWHTRGDPQHQAGNSEG